MKERIEYLSGLLHRREISSAELTEKYIEKIEAENPALNAYVHITFEEARNQALEADKKLKEGTAGKLCGIPMAFKDNICTEGILTTCCSKMLEGYKPFYSATVWERLKMQGAVLLGKTNMDEFAMGSTSETSYYGAPHNPVNREFVTGGSSGGSAAAVAADIAAYALGSDTGGSVRQPASVCGVVGLKPSYGSVSRSGLIAYASSFDQIGVLAATVKDAAMVFDAIRGRDTKDMTTWGVSELASGGNNTITCDLIAEALDEETASAIGIKGLKIGIVKDFFEGADHEVETAVINAAGFYKENGAELVEVSIHLLKEALAAYYVIACAEASSNLGRYDGIRYGYSAENCGDVREFLIKSRSNGFGREVKKRIMLGTYVLSGGYYEAYYKKACLIRNEITAVFDEIFKKCDMLLTPTSPITAFKIGQGLKNGINMYGSDITTVPVNLAGLPAVSIPVGKDGEGLPIGMQLIGKKYGESEILKAAYAYEKNQEKNK